MTIDYYNSKDSVDQYIKMAKDVNSKQLINKLQPMLLPGAKVLELGSGPGTDWQILSKDYEVTGSDLSTEFLGRLRAKFPNGSFLHLNAVTLDTDNQFDTIYSNKVLHHLNDDELKKSILRQADILNKKGLICHSFWQGEGTEMFNGMFVNYHTKQGLRLLFENHFNIILMEQYQEFELNDSLLLVAQKIN